MKRTVLGIVGVILLVAIAFFSLKWLGDGGIPVKTAVVDRGSIVAFVSATGNVINREELSINSPILAQVLNLGAAEGDSVTKGQVLVSLDNRDNLIQIDKARATLKLAEQNQLEVKRDWERLQQIFLVGGESRKTVDEAGLRWQSAQKEVYLAKAELHQIQFRQEQFQLTAPVSGTITSRTARTGVWIKPGDTLFKLAPSGVREIEIKLDASDSIAAIVGTSVTATSDAYPEREWQEKITWVAPTTGKDGAANNLSVRVSLSTNAPSLVLGQQADVKIPTASKKDTLKIPSSAIISRQGKTLVGISENGRVRLVPITIGIEDVTYTEVTSGLQASQRIILPEGKSLREGDHVKIIDQKT